MGVTVSKGGLVTIGADVSPDTVVTITATSVYDNGKSGTSTITVS